MTVDIVLRWSRAERMLARCMLHRQDVQKDYQNGLEEINYKAGEYSFVGHRKTRDARYPR